jgi:hypothetical protein
MRGRRPSLIHPEKTAMIRPRIRRALPLALLLAAAPALASQDSIVTPTSGPHTMAEYAGLANDALLALQSCNSGSTAPANGPSASVVDYQCWADTSAAPDIAFKRFDGTQWVTFGVLDVSAHSWTPYRDGAPVVAVATSGSAADLTTGTLPAARLPNPSGSTLGGVQSLASTASKWLDSISTSGVPHTSQPAFSDISGSWSCGQAPAFSGDISTTAGSCSATIGATKVKSSMLNADVFSTAHTWSGQQSFVAPVLGTPASGVATNLTGTASGLTAGNVLTNADMTGDVTSVGNATTIGSNKVTNAKLATAADGTIKSNISGSTAAPSDNTITSVLDKLFGTTRGSVIYRGASSWAAMTPGTPGQFLTTQGAGANPNWSSGGAGTGTVTSVGLTNSYGLTITSSPITAAGNINAEVGLSSTNGVLGSDVSLNNTSTFFDGPSMAQGSTGKWYACGTITLQDISNSSSNINVRLWDGATIPVMASTVVTTQSGNPNARVSVTLCGIIANPAGNIRISAKDTSATTGVIKANQSGDAMDGTIYGFRLN